MSNLQTLLEETAERQRNICQHIPKDLTERGRLFGFQEAARLAKAYADEHEAKSAGFTVFMREEGATGSTHIEHYAVATAEEAIKLARAKCVSDWGLADSEDEAWECEQRLHVLGVAAGDVTIVEWDDLT